MKIEFEIKKNKLKRKDSSEKIYISQTDVELEFLFDEVLGEKIYLLLETPSNFYRILLDKIKENVYTCEIPKEIFKSTFFKVSLYTLTDDDERHPTNVVIVPLAKSGYKPKPPNCHEQYNDHECNEPCENYPDIFQFILDNIKESINKITVQNRKAYAYHEDEKGSSLIQIIPLPHWVTRQELNDYMGEVITEVELDVETGDLFEVKFNIDFQDID